MMRLGALMLAVVVAFTSAVSAHQSSTYNLDGSVSYIGEIDLWLINRYDDTVTYDVQVLGKDLKPIDPSKWTSQITNNSVTLDKDEVADIRIRVKEKGKYYACTVVAADVNKEANLTIRSRVCMRLWYK